MPRLYGNKYALEEIFRLASREEVYPQLVFNGDFNFFNSSSLENFMETNEMIMKSGAMVSLGNVERSIIDGFSSSSLSSAHVDCGCSYPDYVSDDYIERSNEIVRRLLETCKRGSTNNVRGSVGVQDVVDYLRQLPNFINVDLGGDRVTILHGDCFSLSGWSFSAESLEPADELLRQSLVSENGDGSIIPITTMREVAEWMRAMGSTVVACTHTCLPVATVVPLACTSGNDGILINNGAAGMPNFADESSNGCGVLTRIASTEHGHPPEGKSLYHSTTQNGLRVDAIAIEYDAVWKEKFLQCWPQGTAAHENYATRILRGPSSYRVKQAARQGFEVTQ